jgi:hypothetical protein
MSYVDRADDKMRAGGRSVGQPISSGSNSLVPKQTSEASRLRDIGAYKPDVANRLSVLSVIRLSKAQLAVGLMWCDI